MAFINNGRFEKLPEKVWLSSPSMYKDSLKYVIEAYETNWMSTVGANINEVERIAAETSGTKYAVALSCGTAALHLCMKLAGERLYGKPPVGVGALSQRRVFCCDVTFNASLNPVVYEGGIPVLIDTEYDSWGMNPVALEKAFEMYPEVKLVVYAELYGFPGNIREIKEICEKHGALLVEDAAEAMGATWEGKQCGSYGDYAAVSYNGNKIITGSAGGCLLTNSLEDANQARKWSTQARENAAWYQNEEVGYNYRMSNVIAGVIRDQYDHLFDHIAQKKAIYERYKEGLKGLPVQMNPFDEKKVVPNYWLSCLLIDEAAMCKQVRSETEALYIAESGKSCPSEILDAITSINAEGRPIWKPMHMQPMYRMHEFVTVSGAGRAKTNAYIIGGINDVGANIFHRGVCLPSDNKMTIEQQDKIIEVIKACFE